MPVSSRIKILKCSSFEEVELKVNDFLAFDEHIIHLAGIDYRLEFNVVIIEYDVMSDRGDNDDRNDSRLDYSRSYAYTAYNGWMKLWDPFRQIT